VNGVRVVRVLKAVAASLAAASSFAGASNVIGDRQTMAWIAFLSIVITGGIHAWEASPPDETPKP
jgi:hypothetical protein